MGYVEAGVIHALTRDFDLAAGIIRDINHQGHRVHIITAGMTWRFR